MARTFGRFGTPSVQAPQVEAPKRKSFRCVAHGCPAVAGIGFGAPDSHETICRFHDGKPADQWQKITAELRSRAEIVYWADMSACDDVYKVEGWYRKAEQAMTAIGRPELAPGPSEPRDGVKRDERDHPRLYAQRLNSILTKECVPESTSPSRSAQAASLGHISEFLARARGENGKAA